MPVVVVVPPTVPSKYLLLSFHLSLIWLIPYLPRRHVPLLLGLIFLPLAVMRHLNQSTLPPSVPLKLFLNRKAKQAEALQLDHVIVDVAAKQAEAATIPASPPTADQPPADQT